jgi:hypothetical protein
MAELTPPVINRVPPGLLNFYGLKNGGRAPQALGPVLTPVIELQRFYELDSTEYYADASAPVAAGGVLGDFDFGGGTLTPGTVPEDEFWHVHQYTVQLSIAAACTRYVFVPTVQLRRTNGPGAGSRYSVAVGPPVTYVGAAALAEILYLPADRDFWMPAGAILGGFTLALAPLATAVQAYAKVVLTRYKRL